MLSLLQRLSAFLATRDHPDSDPETREDEPSASETIGGIRRSERGGRRNSTIPSSPSTISLNYHITPASNLDRDRSAGMTYYPSLDDVLTVRGLLMRPLWRRDHRLNRGLPAEIVDMVVDFAEYWPSIEVKMEPDEVQRLENVRDEEAGAINRLRAARPRVHEESGLDGGVEKFLHILQDGDSVLLRTPPLCYDEDTLLESNLTPSAPSPDPIIHSTAHPCRKLLFHITAHDQGWGGGDDGSFAGSWSWFDVEKLPAAHEQLRSKGTVDLPPRRIDLGGEYCLQRNRAVRGRGANKAWQQYEVAWDWRDDVDAESEEAEQISEETGRGKGTLDGRFVRGLEVGDSIAVVGKARFPGWANYVKECRVRVFWAV